MNEIMKAREFISKVKEMAKEMGLNVFVITDGVSGCSNNGNEAIRHARLSHEKWEKAHGFNPKHD